MSPTSLWPGRPTIAPRPTASGSPPAGPASSSSLWRAVRRAENLAARLTKIYLPFTNACDAPAVLKPGIGRQMSTKQDDLAEQLFETLEQSSNRLRAAREEVDSSLALVNLAMAAVAHLRSSTALRTQLGDLLEAQRAGIVRDVTSFLTPGADGTRGPFRFSLDPLQRVALIGRRRIPLTKA